MGAIFNYARVPTIPSALLDFSASGDNSIIAGTSAKRICVYGLYLVSAGATTLEFKDGSSTSLSGIINLSAHQEVHLPLRGEPWFYTSEANDFIISSGSAVQVGGIINYATYDIPTVTGYTAIILIDSNLVRWAVTIDSGKHLITTVTPVGPTTALIVDPLILQASDTSLWQLTIETTGNLTTTLIGSASSPYSSITLGSRVLTVSPSGNLITT